MSRLQAGARIASYELVELAGTGGMGHVYRAVQPHLGRTVALKVIRPELAADEAFRDRFRREARLAASVDHPGVIPIFEAGEADGVLFVAMRWVEGADLRQRLLDHGPLAPGHALELMRQLGAALDAAHSRGLVHRDVKPANVLIESEHVFLSDFGLARSTVGAEEATLAGGFVGTADYVAPEVIEGARADARSDIYALGCVLYEMLTGTVPHPVDGLVAKLHAHAGSEPAPPSELRAGLPVAVDQVVATALAKDPSDRHATAGAFVSALDAALSESERAASAPSKRRTARPSRRVAIVAGACSVIAVVATGAVIAGGSQGPPTRAADAVRSSSACGAPRRVDWSPRAVRACPLIAPLPPNGWIPVYQQPFRSSAARPPRFPSAGWLHGTVGQLFECQRVFTSATYHHPEQPWFNDWWAYTLSDNGRWGWVPEVYFAGGGNDQPAVDLPHCPPAVAGVSH